MGLFDSGEEHPPHKIRRYIITGVAFVVVVTFGVGWWPGTLLRYRTERSTARRFLNTVAAGNLQDAYQIWNASPSYSFKDFLEDWGPESYYGPVRSYDIESIEEIKRGPEPPSGVVVTIKLSPYRPFPSSSDTVKQSKTKEVRLWVQFKDRFVSYAP